MKFKRLMQNIFVMAIFGASLFTLAACQREEQIEEAASTEGEVEVALHPTSTAASLETETKEPTTQQPDHFAVTEFVSTTEFYSLSVPTGWSSVEVIPGADLVMANSEAALERYNTGSAIETGDIILNIGFLPLALLQEDDLSHLGIDFEASPDVFLQSLLPMFRIGDDAAENVVEGATLVSLSDEREAGMLTFSKEGSEGMILMFEAGEGVLAFFSATGFPGKLDGFQETIYALAGEVSFNGAQDALYGVLYGG